MKNMNKLKEQIRHLIRRYAGMPMDIRQQDLENRLLNSVIELVGIEIKNKCACMKINKQLYTEHSPTQCSNKDIGVLLAEYEKKD